MNVFINQVYFAVASKRPLGATHASREERLRRAGYADGERLPRKPHHWANR